MPTRLRCIACPAFTTPFSHTGIKGHFNNLWVRVVAQRTSDGAPSLPLTTNILPFFHPSLVVSLSIARSLFTGVTHLLLAARRTLTVCVFPASTDPLSLPRCQSLTPHPPLTVTCTNNAAHRSRRVVQPLIHRAQYLTPPDPHTPLSLLTEVALSPSPFSFSLPPLRRHQRTRAHVRARPCSPSAAASFVSSPPPLGEKKKR